MTKHATPIKRTITLTSATPIKIVEAAWPTIATGSDHSGEHSFQSFDAAWIKVRRHADGRMIVYGGAGDGDGGGRPTREERRAGYVIKATDSVPEAIRRVVEDIADTEYCGGLVERAGRECLANMPADDLV